jgi:hypothetical protein
MVADLMAYPLKARKDARSAVSDRLAEYLSEIEFTLPKSGQAFKFKSVYGTWADFRERATSGGGLLPAAAVLPDRPIYEPSALTPRALEETWSGGDPAELDERGCQLYPFGDGSGDGHVLVTHSEIVVPFVVVYRAQSAPQRKAIAKRLEEVFLEDGTLIDPSSLNPDVPRVPELTATPVRYGRVLEVPDYYCRKARFTLHAQQLLDTEQTARENRWIGQCEIEGHMQVCVLRRGRAMNVRARLEVDGTTADRTSPLAGT